MGFTVVICSGAWPLAKFFDGLVGAFEAKQQPAICRIPENYPAYDADNPPTVNPDSEYLRTKVLEPLLDQGEDVVIFMHSYGGVYGPASLEGISKKERETKGLKGGVIALVFCAAFVAPKGTTAMTAMNIQPDNLPPWIDHDEKTGYVAFRKEHAKAMLFHDLPDPAADRLADMLPKQPYACFSTPTHYDPFGDPNYQGTLAYIYTEADNIVPYEAQKQYVQMGQIKHTYVLKNSSHSPHIEIPDRLAGVVLDLVKQITET